MQSIVDARNLKFWENYPKVVLKRNIIAVNCIVIVGPPYYAIQIHLQILRNLFQILSRYLERHFRILEGSKEWPHCFTVRCNKIRTLLSIFYLCLELINFNFLSALWKELQIQIQIVITLYTGSSRSNATKRIYATGTLIVLMI